MPSRARSIAGRGEAARLFRAGVQPGLVELDHIGPGRLQVAHLGVDRGGVVHHQLFLVLVKLVLGLARHCERAGQGDLDPALGVGAQELDVAHLDRPQPADRLDDARHHDGAAGAPAHGRRVVEIDPREGRRKAVRELSRRMPQAIALVPNRPFGCSSVRRCGTFVPDSCSQHAAHRKHP